ncbi:MAG: YkgJ family cysteine cluster protein [Candidatus Thorarchaeota archaeon]
MSKQGAQKLELGLPKPLEGFRLIVSPVLKKFTYSCIRCGDCCRERNIWINLPQAEKIANQLGIKLTEADETIFRRCSGEKTELGTFLSLHARKMRLIDDRCPFLERIDDDHTSCTIYSIRPSICRCFPFSYSILVSNKLILVLPALDSTGTVSCKGFRASKDQENTENAFNSASRLVGEIIEDIRITLDITDLKDRISEAQMERK